MKTLELVLGCVLLTALEIAVVVLICAPRLFLRALRSVLPLRRSRKTAPRATAEPSRGT